MVDSLCDQVIFQQRYLCIGTGTGVAGLTMAKLLNIVLLALALFTFVCMTEPYVASYIGLYRHMQN